MKQGRKKSAVLLIYTGGTIGMKESAEGEGLSPFDFSGILSEVPELRRFQLRIESYTFDPLIDSSDIVPEIWCSLADIIKENYDAYDGFVVLHGTDTMAYSASALSFMLKNLGKPVIFTGSQLPIGSLRTDGRENLVSAVEIASAKTPEGLPAVPEVCIYFNSQLLRGNRATKMDAVSFDAFRSPNYPVLAQAGISIRYNTKAILSLPGPDEPFDINTSLDTRVAILKIHPGITPQVARNVLLGKDIRAIILETYGSGNAISKPWFTQIVEEASSQGRILLNVTQCPAGEVNMDLYATGKSLKKAGVISGGDMTTEGALGKLFSLMGKYSDNEVVKRLLQTSVRGEMS